MLEALLGDGFGFESEEEKCCIDPLGSPISLLGKLHAQYM
jgi:hypothetical protein